MKLKLLAYTISFALITLLTILNGYAATFIVDNVGDADDLLGYTAGNGTNSLRKCLRLANSNANGPVVDVINFTNLPLGGPYTILPASNLPAIIDPVLIDGFTAPGYSAPIPFITIKGSGAPASTSPIVNVFNLGAGSSGSTIRGFSLYRTTDVAIYINASSNITVQGCYVGIDQTGALPVPSTNQVGNHGIYITTGSNNCIIGIATAAGRNVISGNLGHGIVLVGCTGGTFKNNFIGTNVAGTVAITNLYNGLNIDNTPSTIIGGAAVNEGNLISGNTQSGMILTNASSNAVIKGNKIGTNLAGTAAVSNGQHGVNIFTNVVGTIIGGALNGEGNLISGNTFNGINIDLNSKKPVIKGNLIGTNAAGMLAVGNKQQGIFITVSDSATIGGGSKAERNIISGNGIGGGQNGIGIVNCNGHIIQGNFCGISITGKVSIPNFDTGISLTNSSGNTIGGAALMQRNVSSSNGIFGMYFYNVNNSSITGNYIGTDSTGKAPLGNLQHGVHTDGGCNLNTWTGNVVGGNGSTIAGVNVGNGLDILTATNNTFYGNYIGLGIDGITNVGNLVIGFRFGLASTNNIVGGSAVGQRNYMAGNGDHAIYLDEQSVSNIFKNNYVGSDITGLIPIPNKGIGIFFLDESNNNTVGGTLANEGNLLCCSSTADGIRTQISNNNTYYGNLVGVNATGSIAVGFGNFEDGVQMGSYWNLGSTNNSNIVGGLAAGQKNIIANNGRDGVHLAVWGGSNGTNFNPIIGNSIYCNVGLGIHMEATAFMALENEGILAPTVTSSTTNAVSGTGTTGNTIHVYRNQTSGPNCGCQGEIYIGTTVVAGGTWSITHNLGLTPAQALSVTATQTNPTNSTSQFWVCSVPLPVELLSLEAKKINTTVSVNFSVSNESNINLYYILKSKDGINFEMVGSVIPVNGPGIHAYSFEDLSPSDGINYYRIQTVENDGREVQSKIVYINTNSVNTYLYPNPATEQVTVVASGIISRVELNNTLGQLVYEKNISAPELIIPLTDLSTGVYYVKVYEGENIGVYKLEKK
jgi:hypothetical protein